MSIYHHADCMNPETGLPSYPDKHFDLAIVDPPYLDNYKNMNRISVSNNAAIGNYHYSSLSNGVPTAEYWAELKRVSKDQIVWGANYFANHLKPTPCVIVWDKNNSGNFADCEIAFGTFGSVAKIFKHTWNGMIQENMKNKQARIHPTEKPMALYRWLLKNYAKQGDLILDTHVGSASSLVVFEEMDFDYVAFEKDADYYRDSTARLEAFRAQPKLFTGKEIFEATQGEQQSLFPAKL